MADREVSSPPTVIEFHYRDLFAYVARKLGSSMFAADIVHDAYVRVRQLPSLLTVRNPRAYLFRTATNLIIDYHRQEQRRGKYLTPESLLEEIPAGNPSLDAMLDEKRQLAILRVAIDELPSKCQQVFIMRKFEGLEQEEIASQLGISRNMVEKHLRKALLYCRARMEQALK
jgi:RNA polymerase sigma factor (sigma-70 family)